ncbi:MAG: iron ABC transporter substrate-binding protein [Chloroflexi bacterium]|nr:iron ABC transporter substrate-binding protein [Chloroflexota bacterium]MCH7952830.1 iron ABC transporter substrate-binding protein [Chloroflexota bacterium]MCI0783512.1 iron ABC transporter substrate-binding protein [Chloroflexota bacterium]MCI0814077.1 iron ABC transporter substrate-binding protein [Chloroflexota bacterium]MCI0816781.1 iron ABC transporter substrate-binding protein [Chloroflexota bacterium]
MIRLVVPLLALLALSAIVACGGDDAETLTIYSGRSETLVKPILDQFAEESGVKVRVRYGDTAELAATILEEGGNSPADVFFAQDAGALGALADAGLLKTLPNMILDLAPSQYRSRADLWVGISGRARVVAYNTDVLSPDDLPDSIFGFTDPEWEGRIGWAPQNGSFQAFVTGLRVLEGDDAARDWLEGILANDPTEYPNNTTSVEGVANGEVDVAFVNHYYLYRFLDEEGDGFKARNYYTGPGDAGSLVNIAGAGILKTTNSNDLAEQFLKYMLGTTAQQYFADETYEYPVIAGIAIQEGLVPLAEVRPPDIDLSDLSDLNGTLDLLRETGALP